MSESAGHADEKRGRLQRYLTQRAADGEYYFKSKFITEDVGLSAKEIGVLLRDLRESCEQLRIEKWAYSGATTWRVVRDD